MEWKVYIDKWHSLDATINDQLELTYQRSLKNKPYFPFMSNPFSEVAINWNGLTYTANVSNMKLETKIVSYKLQRDEIDPEQDFANHLKSLENSNNNSVSMFF